MEITFANLLYTLRQKKGKILGAKLSQTFWSKEKKKASIKIGSLKNLKPCWS